VNWRAGIAIFIVVALVAGIGSGIWFWEHQRNNDPLANIGNGVYQAPSSGETAPLPAPHH
jgi:hypothetical protein